MPRGRVIGAGCLIWATFTALFGEHPPCTPQLPISLLSCAPTASNPCLHSPPPTCTACTSSLTWALPICAVNGLGLALVIPSVQSLIADMNASEARGQAFGKLWLTISFGGMLGALYATNMGAYKPLGIEGWRFAFVTVAVLSGIAGLLNAAYVVDPTYQQAQQAQHAQRQHVPEAAHTSLRISPRSPHLASLQQQQQQGRGLSDGATSGSAPTDGPRLDAAMLKSVAADIASVLRIPTFTIIIVQGIIGSVPYASLVFLTLYLQLIGMSDAAASALVALYLVGGGFGGLLGGWIGDTAAQRFPNHGRIACTQLSVAMGVPFAALIFKVGWGLGLLLTKLSHQTSNTAAARTQGGVLFRHLAACPARWRCA